MGAKWDSNRGGRDAWVTWLAGILAEARRTLKPGACGFIWALPKTSHWTGLAIERAGFEVRDVLHDAVPPSTLLDQFLDSLDGEQRAALDRVLEAAEPSRLYHVFGQGMPKSRSLLKPAVEHWYLVRNPGPLRPLRIDDCRIPTAGPDAEAMERCNTPGSGRFSAGRGPLGTFGRSSASPALDTARGRCPANLVLEHAAGCRQVGFKEVRSTGHYPAARGAGSQVCGASGHRGQQGLEERHTAGEKVPVWECAEGCPVLLLDNQTQNLHSSGSAQPAQERWANPPEHPIYGKRMGSGPNGARHGDKGTASRFFHQMEFDPFLYQAKASTSERDVGCEGLPGQRAGRRNFHNTVKPVALMRHLVRLITPPGGTVLDPFAGSGTTGVACAAEGLGFFGIEMEQGFAEIARARLRHALTNPVPEIPKAARKSVRQKQSGQLGLL